MEQQAIQAALLGQWKKAVSLNEELLKEKPDDTEALTRLAFACARLGNYTKACKTYQSILNKDPFHPIASKNFAKYKSMKNCSQRIYQSPGGKPLISPSLFLIDHNQTKSVTLINAAPKTVLNNLSAGEEVQAAKRGYDLQIKNGDGTYVGTFPDDIGRLTIAMLTKGEYYRFFVKDIKNNAVTIFVKCGPQ